MHTRPCWVEIRPRAFEENYRFLASAAAPHAELLAIVKADAYGHSLAICAPAAVRAGARWLGVTSVEEGVSARALCPEAGILVISGAFSGQGTDVVQHRLTAVAWEQWQLDELEIAAHAAHLGPGSLPIHLEIDTGMSRQGADPADLGPLLARFTGTSPLRLEGVMTHLYAADEANGDATRSQLERLALSLQHVRSAGLQPLWLNVGNSAALLAGQASILADLAAQSGFKALLRPGLALYGTAPQYDPAFESAEPAILVEARQRLQPVLAWKSKVASVHSIERGAVIGYNGTFVATQSMRIALVSVGYADGLDRRLGNRFALLVRGQRAPLVGRISMDHSVLDVTEISGVVPGDEVVLLGMQGNDVITADDHAIAAGTIPWDVFTRIAARVPRIAV
ncbi:MAG TPA: alanine racemase [Terracidiphilus sp.]|jgi:alanine racemase|nr:alanine racemase [Terracidiphilus sp.]